MRSHQGKLRLVSVVQNPERQTPSSWEIQTFQKRLLFWSSKITDAKSFKQGKQGHGLRNLIIHACETETPTSKTNINIPNPRPWTYENFPCLLHALWPLHRKDCAKKLHQSAPPPSTVHDSLGGLASRRYWRGWAHGAWSAQIILGFGSRSAMRSPLFTSLGYSS